MTSPAPPPTLGYAGRSIAQVSIERGEGWIVLRISTPRLSQLLAARGLAIGFLIPLTLAMIAGCIFEDDHGFTALRNCTIFMIALVAFLIREFVRVVHSSRRETILSVSDGILNAVVAGTPDCHRQSWACGDIKHLELGESLAILQLYRQLAIRVMHNDDRIEIVRFPWNGKESLQEMRKALWDAIADAKSQPSTGLVRP